MRDIIFTIVAFWVIYKIIESINTSKKTTQNKKREGETTVNYTPPKKKDDNNNDGEYVDYEEVK